MKVSRSLFKSKSKVVVVATGALLMSAACNDIDEASGQGIVRAGVRAQTVPGASSAAASAQAVRSVLPSAQVYRQGDRISRLYGANMAEGATAEAAAEAFRVKAAGVLGAVANDLQPAGAAGAKGASAQSAPVDLMVDKSTGTAKFKLYRYAQVRGGIPVYGAGLATLVKNSDNHPVVSATSTLRDLKDFAPAAAAARAAHVAIDPAKSVASLRPITGSTGKALPLPKSLARYTEPELVIYAGAGNEVVPPRLAMQYVGENDDPPGKWLFIADAATADILYNVSQVVAANVSGTVKGNATSGYVASECAAEVATAFPYARVSTPSTSGFTSSTGYFYLANSGTDPVAVLSRVSGGNYIDVINDAGAGEELTMTVTPPNAANFMHNQANTDALVRAQTNAYVAANRVRDFVVGYLPTYPTIGTQTGFPVHANGPTSDYCPGNAWYFFDGHILLCQQSSWVTNTAFGSVVYHEYGHHVVQMGTSVGNYGPYGEGMADTISALVAEDPRMAIGWNLNDCNSWLRTADNDCRFDAGTCTTNCGSESHDCGRLISGIVWDIRARLMATHPSDYRDIVNALVLSSIPMHSDWTIDGAIAVDMLNLDDDDGNLDNGTPHRAEICGGFAEHGIQCPGMNPCASHCTSPDVITWTGSYQSGSLGTGTICRETTQAVVGGNCGNFASGRQLLVNGTPMTCNGQNWTSLPAAENGGYCITTTSGDYDWAFFTLW